MAYSACLLALVRGKGAAALVAQGQLVQFPCEEQAVLLGDDHGAGKAAPLAVAGGQQEAVPGAEIEQRVVFEVGVAVKVTELERVPLRSITF